MSKSLTILSLVLFLFASCGEDRTYEYEEKTQGNHEMQSLMQEWYLWGDSLKELDWKQYFASPTAFLPKLTSQSPNGYPWSYCSIDTIIADYHTCGYFNHCDSYGLDITLMTDPTGETTKQYARVLTVYPNSPAEQCGLQRGDFISQVGDAKMSKTVMSQLVSGRERTLVVSRLAVDADEILYWTSTDTLQLSRSRAVDVSTVMISRMLTPDVAYLMLTDLIDFTQISPSLSRLLTQSPSALIIDLRLCNQGSIDCAIELANKIGNASGIMLRTIWNSRKSANNTAYNISVASGLDLYFITSSYTQGAAEWLIYGLQSMQLENIKIVGQATAGQTVMLHPVPTVYQYTLYPAVAYVCNADGNHDYDSGIVPDDSFNEFDYVHLYPYGDIREAVVSHILFD